MSYAAIMVHFDNQRDARRRVQLAAALAGRFDATLIGIAGSSYLPSFLANGRDAGVGAADGERQEMAEILADLGTKFRSLAKQTERLEWRGSIDPVNYLVPREARAADLVVVGRALDPGDIFYSLDPGIAVLRSGRPVLFVPGEIDVLAARRVVVGWKDCREARRAVQDALPFLRAAGEVMIVTVCENVTEPQAQSSIDDLTAYLRRHKVDVRGKVCLHPTRSITSELLDFADDESADLIVAGGYGRSRLGEWVLGGVTRDLLAKARTCCLFSH
jgi:nucleotide-binding universal stress UspA family protein